MSRIFPLGRHVEHDPRSLAFQIAPSAAPIESVRWTRRAPIFDQGEVGSCVGNACAGALGTDWSEGQGNADMTEADALALYELATTLDSVPGSYPPDDTGSTGLAVAKAAQRKGLIKGYRHAIGFDQFLAALMQGPCIVGTNWHAGMDTPKAGRVRPTGAIRGGHEYECLGYDASHKVLTFANSWGASWGQSGFFTMTAGDFKKLLAEQGDATQLVR